MVSLAQEARVDISQKGGSVHYTVLADMMEIGSYYAQLICMLLNRDDYIAMDATGACKITRKGENFLEKETLLDNLNCLFSLQ